MTEQSAQKTRKRVVEQWETISVTALPPGWVNVYELENEGGAMLEVPCPAMLLQELRSVSHCYDELDENGNYRCDLIDEEPLEPPYQRRVEAADMSEGWVQVASDIANFFRTELAEGPDAGTVLLTASVLGEILDRQALGHEIDDENDNMEVDL
ncbi:MAG: hypothetical protein GX610_09415 [Rhodococcus sp.]|nr:hypothetical protein [Rhodococcus sp. (in: high G+C Gram-positive bacteria)]